MNLNLTPQSRVLLYVLIGSLVPLILVFFMYHSRSSKLDSLERDVLDLHERAHILDRKQSTNKLVRQHFKDADRFYLDKHVESLNLLEPQVEALQKATNQKSVQEDPKVVARLNALQQNALIFSEGAVQSYTFFNEIPETLGHPIEVDMDDIKRILARVEGVSIGDEEPGPNRPQLIITDFRLEKKKAPSESEVYLLNMKLIKREYL